MYVCMSVCMYGMTVCMYVCMYVMTVCWYGYGGRGLAEMREIRESGRHPNQHVTPPKQQVSERERERERALVSSEGGLVLVLAFSFFCVSFFLCLLLVFFL